MSVTVADCLKLPALWEAQVVAGKAGLNRPVASLSVLEEPDVDMLSDALLVGNELLISALVSIKDDVEAQCFLLRHLHSMGEACLVLYYVGIYITELDERVIQTADELNFPLIVMPVGRMDFRYSDVIMEVMELVQMHQKQERYYVSEMLNRISLIAPQHRTPATVMRLLSDRLRSTLVLADHSGARKSSAPWPTSNQWDYKELLEMLQTTEIVPEGSLTTTIQDRQCIIWDVPVTAKKMRMYHLYVLDEQGNHDYEDVRQAGEVLEVYLNIWSDDRTFEHTDELVHAILSDRPAEMNRIATELHIDIKSIHTIWMMKVTSEKGELLRSEKLFICTLWCKQYMQEHYKNVFVDAYGEYLVAFASDPIFEEDDVVLLQSFFDRMKQERFRAAGVVCQDIQDTSQARAAYLCVMDHLDDARRIFQHRVAFPLSEIHFAERCSEIVAAGETKVKNAISCLDRLQELDDGEDLRKTLCTFLLDSDQNVAKTGTLLFLHRNSVQHRLNKIKLHLHSQITQMPDLLQFYPACAILRLLGM